MFIAAPPDAVAVNEKVTLAPGSIVTAGEKVIVVRSEIAVAVALAPVSVTVAVKADSDDGSLTDTISDPMSCTCCVRLV